MTFHNEDKELDPELGPLQRVPRARVIKFCSLSGVPSRGGKEDIYREKGLITLFTHTFLEHHVPGAALSNFRARARDHTSQTVHVSPLQGSPKEKQRYGANSHPDQEMMPFA